MGIAVVTDSTTYLPQDCIARHGITVVPLVVLINGKEGLDGVDVGPDQLIEALKARCRVTTSMRPPDVLAKTYTELLDGGADAVVAVHLSSDLSGTWGSAARAADGVCRQRGRGKVRVVDSRTTVMALGFAAQRAAQAAAGGADIDEVVSAAEGAAATSHTLFMVETLEYLRRGGRIGTAAALLGTALAVKPLLCIEQGKIQPLEKVRTTSRALARLVDIAVGHAGDQPVELAVQHLGAPERAGVIADQLSARLPAARECVISELGAVIGAHTGPGVVGVVVQPS